MARHIKTHTQFLLDVEKYNPTLLKEYNIISSYEGKKSKIILKSNLGEFLMSPGEILAGSKPNISSAINKELFILNKVKSKYKDLDIELTKNSKFINMSFPLLFKNKYGDFIIRPDKLLEGSKPNIIHALNKNEYFYNILIEKHPHYKQYGLKLLNDYKLNNIPIKFEFNGIIYKRLPLSLMQGSFTGDRSYGTYNKTIVERNKSKYIQKDCILYKIRLYNNDENFYKIGISTINIQRRFANIPYDIEIIELINTNLYDGFYKELDLHNDLEKCKYEPLIKFGGYRECFWKI